MKRPSYSRLIKALSTESWFPGFVILCFAVLCPSALLAQNIQNPQSAVDNLMRSNMHIDPSTGALQLQVPLGGYPGRGEASLPVTLNYSSKVWNIKFVTSSSCSNEPVSALRADYAHSSASGWTSSVGWFLPPADVSLEDYDSYTLKPAHQPFRSPQDCCSSLFHIMRMFVTLWDGSRHELRRDDARHDPSESRAGVYYSVDGSRLWYDSAQDILFMPNGSRLMHYSSGLIAGNPSLQYVDRNGNFLTYSPDSGMWTDTLNRHIGAPVGGSAPIAGDYPYALPGFNNVPLTYTMRWRNLSDVLTDPSQQLHYLGDSLSANCGTGNPQSNNLFNTIEDQSKVLQGAIFNPVVLYQIALPNGSTYTFTYNIYGEIDKIAYPTGGIEQFTYGQVLPLGGQLDDGTYSQANRGIISRTVTDGVTTQPWQYGSPNDAGVDPATAARSVTSPDGTVTKTWYYKSRGTDIQYGFDDARTGMAREERVYDSAGTMLRRTLFSVVEDGPQSGGYATATRNARITKKVDIILDTGGGNPLAAATETAYDSDLNVISTKHYDYVSIDQATAQTADIPGIPNGTRLRTEETDYLTGDANYRALNLLSLPSATRVRDGSSGQGNIVAQSSISYDESAYPLLDYGAANGWAEPGTNARGNPTSVSHWLNTTNTYLQSHVQYDHFGNVRKSWDAKGNLSQIDYSASYQYAYPTTSTSADPDGAGPLTPLVTTTAYDLSSGVVTSTTDPNNQTSTLEYAAVDALANPNPMQRLTRVNQPDGGWTAFAYGDQPGNLFMLNRTALDATRSTESTKYFDALGRGWRSTMSEGAALIYSDQHYDSMGRVSQVSNPYRAGDTIQWTTTGYDSLGRVVSVTTPDSSALNSYYNGNQVLVRDQAGKERMSQTNSLGQLTNVWEMTSADDATEAITFPNRSEVSAGYRTKYEYEALGNLITVTQRVGTTGLTQTRSFVYDSLSRLTAATNPESGAINYDYDENGNLLHKIDPRLLADNATHVKVTYDYDALNRVKTRTYNDGTPTVTHSYDPSISNGKGRLSSVSSIVSTYTYSSYDAMGRVLSGSQTLGGETYSLSYAYDLSGQVTSMAYPSGRSVTYVYDAAGRMNSVTGNLGDGTTRTYSTGISYDAAGRMNQEQFGTNTPIYDKLSYNTRGQLAEILASTTGGDASYNRGKIINDYSLQCSGASCNATDNNGNLRKQTVYLPNNDQNTNPTSWYQQYDYDSLNRLTQVQEHASNTNLLWQQQYVYDRYGNRTINNSSSATWGNSINNVAAAVDAGNNRMYAANDPNHTVIDYDAAGNQTKDYLTSNGTRVYDAENRMISTTDSSFHTSTYTYDGDGRRVKRNINGTETWQVYGLRGELLAEYAANSAASNPQKEYGYRNGQMLITADAPTGTRTNVALASNGGTATASSYYSDAYWGAYVPALANDGDRKGAVAPGQPGGWNDAAPGNTFPGWLEIDFTGSKTIDEIDVITSQDNYTNPAEPTESMTFSQFGLTGCDVQYWNGSAWITVTGGNVSGNNKVWQKITFSALTTSKIRVLTNASADGYSRIKELEAWGTAAPLSKTNVALTANGGTATASSYWSDTYWGSFVPALANDGDRKGAVGPGQPGGWSDAAPGNTFPDWLEIDFTGSKTIDEIDVITSQDNYANPAEPTESMTFSQFGLTGYDVQYWNGSAWITVTGGNVSGNNKVWQKITFSALTTSKIRVLTNASADGYSRIKELEAWTAGASAQLHWLVTDQLGTPRMIFDQSGSLASLSRHDYLPFGEELSAGVGGRTQAQGYGVADGVRQQFTGQQRDNETNLDYFGARYYASAQGRFTSADDFLLDTHPNDPESWNLYTYVRNNPLAYTDPSGQIIQNTDDRKHQLSKGELKAIRDDLRKKAGLKSINFDKKTGTFSYDKNETAKGGSAELRQQITGAIDDQKNVFKLNDYSGTESLQFADTDAGTVLSNTGVTTYQVRIDFSDFRDAKVLSDKEAIKAFSLGFVLSHEVDHKVSYDPNNPCPLGGRPDDGPYGVIADVNLAQSQLGLATRSPGSHTGQPYHGLDSRFKNTYQIQFNNASGQARFLRWKLESQR